MQSYIMQKSITKFLSRSVNKVHYVGFFQYWYMQVVISCGNKTIMQYI